METTNLWTHFSSQLSINLNHPFSTVDNPLSQVSIEMARVPTHIWGADNIGDPGKVIDNKIITK